jgi:putative transposase
LQSTILKSSTKAAIQRHGLPPASERKRTTTWPAFIRTQLALLAGTDFFTAEVLTLRGLITYYVLFFIHLESRRVDIAALPFTRTSRG